MEGYKNNKDMALDKEEILKIVRKNGGKPMTVNELAVTLNEEREDIHMLERLLDELIYDGDLFKTKKNKYMTIEAAGMVKGRLLGNERGFGFVEPASGGDDVYISADNMGGALNSDEVLVTIIDDTCEYGRWEGRVVRILRENVKTVVGTLDEYRGSYFVKPDNKKLGCIIGVLEKDLHGARKGQKVMVEIEDRFGYRGYGANSFNDRDGGSGGYGGSVGRDGGSGGYGGSRGSYGGSGGYGGSRGNGGGRGGNGSGARGGASGKDGGRGGNGRGDRSGNSGSNGGYGGGRGGNGSGNRGSNSGSNSGSYGGYSGARGGASGKDVSPSGKIIEVIGYTGDPGVDVLSIIRECGFSTEFPDKVLQESEAIDENVSESNLQGRRDLRGQRLITIDGADSKDLDDAVSIEPLANGGYRLGVHIADVSAYVKEGSELDREAFDRGTSLYFVDRVLPMLPQKLSNGICSLHPNVDRLALSVVMDIDGDGAVLDHEIFESVIRTVERMTYDSVYMILEEGDAELKARYSHIVGDLELMAELTKKLRRRRLTRGAIDFSFNEALIKLDEDGKPIDISVQKLTLANRIIEEFMIVCNETVAERMFWADAPFIYRTHDKPDPEKIMAFKIFAGNLGYKLKTMGGGGRMGATGSNSGSGGGSGSGSGGGSGVGGYGGSGSSSGNGSGSGRGGGSDSDSDRGCRGNSRGVRPKELQAVVDAARDSKYEKVINTVLLRSMAKAKYTRENIGHFGLSSDYYCHFTSPIRRYPDLMIHRLIKLALNNQLGPDVAERYERILPGICIQCSNRERAADEAERQTEDLKKVEYMEQFVGDVFEGVISNVTSFGMFVELANTVEGLIRMADMYDDYYEFHEKQYCLIGERSKKTFRIGDVVKVVLVFANVNARQIDFGLIRKM